MQKEGKNYIVRDGDIINFKCKISRWNSMWIMQIVYLTFYYYFLFKNITIQTDNDYIIHWSLIIIIDKITFI